MGSSLEQANSHSTVKFSEYRNQLVAALCVNILTLASGISQGWLSPIILLLQSENTPLDSGPATVAQISWLGSLLCVGAVVSSLFYGFLINRLGRKIALYATAIPQVVFWLLIMTSSNIYYLYVARLAAGFSAGGTFVTMPVYVSDISNKHIRGSLSSYFRVGQNVGNLLGYVVGAYLDYYTIPKFVIVLPLIYMGAVYFLPETPQFLLQREKEEEAKNSIIFYNNLGSKKNHDKDKLNTMLEEMKSTVSKSKAESVVTLADFWNPEARKSLMLSFGIVTASIMCGIFGIRNYTGSMFAETGSEIDPNTCAIIIGVAQLAGTYLNSFIVDKLSRKFLMISTTILMILLYVLTGLYIAYIDYLYQVYWLPIVTLSMIILLSAVGVVGLSFVLVAELLPSKIRPIGMGIVSSFMNLVAFGFLKLFPIIMYDAGLDFVMWLCAAFNLVIMLFVIFFIPETRGKAI